MGENPTQYLDEKTKEKTLAEEMKRTHGTERYLCDIIIKRISDAVTQMTTKILACKMPRKYRKEEVLAGVVVAAAQCANGTSLRWVPYLLNLFLEERKDVHDLGTEFHYSWLLMLIMLMGWRESPYSYFCEWIGRCRVTRYTLLGRKSDPKHRSTNTGTFSKYFIEIQESIANTWRITPDVVAQYNEIANFHATRHTMWIQVHRDPHKGWLQPRYCVNGDDIEMAMWDWHDDWMVLVLTQKVPLSTEADTTMPNKLTKPGKPTQKTTQ
jgi:hypothetical protein